MTIGCIIQARMTSSRLPGKVLKPLGYSGNGTILENVISRVKSAKHIDKTIVACTVNPNDDVIAPVAEKCGTEIFRGSEEDVLSRFYLAAKKYGFDEVVRITSDCPFIDADVLDELVDFFNAGGYDYASNAIERTYPHGLDCEIFSFSALERAMQNGKTKPEREHVTYYMYTHPEEFRIGGISLPSGENYSDLRITVDTEADYVLACVIRDLIGSNDFNFRDIINMVNDRPYLRLINANVKQKSTFISAEEELNAAIDLLKLQEMYGAVDLLTEMTAR